MFKCSNQEKQKHTKLYLLCASRNTEMPEVPANSHYSPWNTHYHYNAYIKDGINMV